MTFFIFDAVGPMINPLTPYPTLTPDFNNLAIMNKQMKKNADLPWLPNQIFYKDVFVGDDDYNDENSNLSARTVINSIIKIKFRMNLEVTEVGQAGDYEYKDRSRKSQSRPQEPR